MSVYLFDIGGRAIAFQRSWDDECVFTVDGDFLGRCVDRGFDVVDPSGRYVGTVVGDRLVRRNDAHCVALTEAVEPVGRAVPTGRPSAPLRFEHPFAYEDVALARAV
jgi:hypothetical protein